MSDEQKKRTKLLREMLSMTDSVWHAEGAPRQLRTIAHSMHRDVRELERRLRVKAKRTGRISGPGRPQIQTIGVEKRIATKTDKFGNLVKKSPKYSSAEFKCVDDYEKCKEHRGERDIHCKFAYFICLAKRIIPLVRQK